MKLPLIPQALALVLFAGLLACTSPAPSPFPPADPYPMAGPALAPPPPSMPPPPAPVYPLPTPYGAPMASVPSYAPPREVMPMPAPRAPRHEPMVYIASSGHVYHNIDCVHLRHAKSKRKVTLAEARKAGHPDACNLYKPE